jgi:phytanoyl-CoA dioxygenase PhyH
VSVLLDTLGHDGWVLVERMIPPDLLDRLRRDLEAAFAWQRTIQIRNGVGDGANGTVHHLPIAGGSFLEFLDRGFCGDILDAFFAGPSILNTFGGVLNQPDDLSYVGRVHRDLRSFSGSLPLMAQLLVLLDDFTEENGATYLLSGSHRMPEQPRDDVFFRDAIRAVAPAGSIVVFNSNLWHAAGPNRSRGPRRALTLAFTKPFVKQQLDYPRALGDEIGATLSPVLRQVLGYNARVPASLDEWYQPPERRLYQKSQG